MKNRLLLFLIFATFIISLAACKNKDANADKEGNSISIQADVVEFVNDELAPILTYRNTAISSYNSYFQTNEMDTQAFLTELEAATIPNMEAFLEGLNNIEVATPEVCELKEIYILSATKQLEAMKLVALAIKEENPDYLTQADVLISEAGKYMTQYESALKTLCEEHNIDIEGSF